MKIKQHNSFLATLALLDEDIVHIRYAFNQIKGALALQEQIDMEEFGYFIVGINDFLQEISVNLNDVNFDEACNNADFLKFIDNLYIAKDRLLELQMLLVQQNKSSKNGGNSSKIQMLSNKFEKIASEVQAKMGEIKEKGE